MAHDAFDGEIERLFAQPPALDDGAAFEARVGARLNRGSRIRTALLTAGGVVGGVLAVREALETGLAGELSRVSEESTRSVDALSGSSAWSQLWQAAQNLDLSAMPSMPLFWALTAVLIGLAALTVVKTADAG